MGKEMVKDAFYFSHDSNARTDEKIIEMRMVHGWEGYGIYWAIIELLRETSDYRMRTHYERIAYALQTQSDLIKSVINDFGLFVIDNKSEYFWSQSLLRRMEMRENKSKKARKSANARWGKENNRSESNANALQTHSERNARKGKEIKETKEILLKYRQNSSYFDSDEIFDMFCDWVEVYEAKHGNLHEIAIKEHIKDLNTIASIEHIKQALADAIKGQYKNIKYYASKEETENAMSRILWL